MDFTVNTYRKLLDQLIKANYTFQTFSEFIEKPEDRVIILRHDVDAKKMNSLHFAKIQHELGIKGTYYFRMAPQSFDEEVIKEIASLGHEIGYHYEDMDFAFQKIKNQESRIRNQESRVRIKDIRDEDLYDTAIEIFKENLTTLRKLFPAKTICMHGSPRSSFDNKAVWKKYNYRDYGIIGEPYFDIDFNKVFYITDTGRRWDGDKMSIRDKVDSGFNFSFHHTRDIIQNIDKLPGQVMFTFHPQRWTNKPIPWLWELLFQNVKNQVKKYYLKKN